MDNYTKGSEFHNGIILKNNSPYLTWLIDHIYDDWNNQNKVYDRWKIMNNWVSRFKQGATFEEMVNCSEAESYIKWWLYTANNNNIKVFDEDITIRKNQIVDMIFSIANDGYHEEKYVNKENEIDPIEVSIDSTGVIHIFDGAHRTMILSSLGMDVPVKIHTIHDDFLKTVTSLSMLYQPSSHPCVQNLKVVRKDNIRYEVIKNSMKKLGIISACEIGCAEGEGLNILNDDEIKVIGIENEKNRLSISNSLCKVTGNGKVIDKLNNVKYDAFIGLSVWHHIAEDLQTLNQWIERTKYAKHQYVEMPEPYSKTFKPQLINDTGWNWENVGEELVNHIMKIGEYKTREVIYTDKKYANRETILLSK